MKKEEILTAFMAAGVFDEDIKKFKEWNGTFEEFVIKNPEYILWSYANYEPLRPFFNSIKINGEVAIDWCANQEPEYAILHAAEHLSPSTLEKCAKKDPIGALSFAAILLPEPVLEQCARQAPLHALLYATTLLSPSLLNWCVNNLSISKKYG